MMYDFIRVALKTKLEWKLPVAGQWAGKAKPGGAEEWTTLYRPSKVHILRYGKLTKSAFAFGLSSDFVPLTPE